jgi:hypothetical protein
MKLFIFLFALQAWNPFFCVADKEYASLPLKIQFQDSVWEKQLLYNGIIWKNKYHRILGDQFLFSNLFLHGTIFTHGKQFGNVRIKYDILSDEIITPVNTEDILQLNSEMVDSFSIVFGDKTYRFINNKDDTIKDLNGYVNLLYKGRISFYAKYKKTISPSFTQKSDGEFIQTQFMYLLKDNLIHPVFGIKTLFKIYSTNKKQIRNFILKNKLKISKKTPESLIPVIRFCDSLSR